VDFEPDAGHAEWDSLTAPGMATAFCGPAWTSAAWRHLPDLGTPHPMKLADKHGVTLLPTSVVDDVGRRRFVFAGGPLIDSGDALSSIADPVEHIRHLLEQARCALAARDWLDLRPVRPDSHLARSVARGELAGYTCRVAQAGTSPVIPLGTPPASTLSSRFDAKLSRRWAQITARGQLRWRRHWPVTAADIHRFLQHRQLHWTQRRGALPWPQEEPGFDNFLATALTGPGTVTGLIDELWLDGELVAQDLYVRQRAHLLQYMRWFHTGYARYTPGHLLVRHSLQAGWAGVAQLDLGCGDEPWKYQFGATDTMLQWIALTAN
jgi:CelD/BcsL family acetyltransferase involved in cellulose biosynthesis